MRYSASAVATSVYLVSERKKQTSPTVTSPELLPRQHGDPLQMEPVLRQQLSYVQGAAPVRPPAGAEDVSGRWEPSRRGMRAPLYSSAPRRIRLATVK